MKAIAESLKADVPKQRAGGSGVSGEEPEVKVTLRELCVLTPVSSSVEFVDSLSFVYPANDLLCREGDCKPNRFLHCHLYVTFFNGVVGRLF